jgi:GTPase SAR1 family protein
MILVGNKVDKEDQRAVTKDEAAALAREFGNIHCVEVSAFSNIGINGLFDDIVKTIFIADSNAGKGKGADSKGVLGAGAAAPATAKAEEKKKKSGCSIL